MIIVPKKGLYVPSRFKQKGSITHFASVVSAAAPAGPDFIVAMGPNRTETDADFPSPFDSRAGYRITASALDQETGNSPSGGGAIVTWNFDNKVVTPTGFIGSDFEVKWDEISVDTGATRNFPVAEATFIDLGTLRTWTFVTTTAGIKTWVFDVTAREKADVSNNDVVRITLNVEGVV